MDDRNPFVFDRPLGDPEELVGREDDLAGLLSAVRGGGMAIVEGPHRYGKTSLLNVALASVASDGGLGVRVDCAGVLTVDDVVGRLRDAFANALADGELEEALIDRLEAVGFQVESGEAPEPAARLTALLGVATEVAGATSRPVVICFDEVQDAMALPAAAAAIAAASSARNDRVGFVFAGPDVSISDGSESAKGAISTIPVGPIDPIAFVAAITSRFEQTGRDAGEAAKIVAQVGAGHPQRTNLLAWHLWEMTGEGEKATAVYARLAINNALERIAPELEIRWQALHSNERRVAVAIASDLAPQGTKAQRATGLAGFGAAQRALQGVKASGVARTDGDQTTLTDPLFAEWLRRRYEHVPPEPDWQALRRRNELQRGGITRGM